MGSVVIRWVRPDLGTGAFERVFAEASASDFQLVDVRALVDGAGNTGVRIDAVIEEVILAIRAGRRVVVACDLGISRSNAVAAGVVARLTGVPLGEAVRMVVAATGAVIRPEVLASVASALADSSATSATRPTGRTVLVTGATGALGARIASALSDLAEVVTPTRAELDLVRAGAELGLLARERRVSAVYHFASPRTMNTNAAVGDSIAMLRSVADACLFADARLVFPSRAEVFWGYVDAPLAATEDTPRRPAGCLGDAKHLGETLLESYRSRGLVATVLRSGPVVDAGGLAPRFVRTLLAKASRGETLVTHRFENGPPQVDFVALCDYLDAARASLDAAPGVFHLGTASPLATDAVARLLVEEARSTSQTAYEDVAGAAPHVSLGCARAIATLGVRPRPIVEILGQLARSGRPDASTPLVLRKQP